MTSLGKNALLSMASLATSVLLAEVALWAVGFSYPNLYLHDAQMGAVLRPGAKGWWREEGEAFISINSAGMRDDREHSQAKPPGTYRIAVLGDSYAEALQVPVEKTFWWNLEGRLTACDFAGGKRIEVLNFGVSGYSTSQELLMLRQRAAAFGPDLVLLAFLSGNDVRDNSKEIAGGDPRPYFLLEREVLVLDSSFRDHWIFRLKSSAAWQFGAGLSTHSRLLQLLNKVKNILGQSLSTPRTPRHELDIGLDDHAYLSRPPEPWERAWQLTERLITELEAEAFRAGSHLLLVTLTNPGQVPINKQSMRQHANKLGEPDLFYPERRLRAFAERQQIEAVFLAEDFAEFAATRGVHLHGFPNTQPGSGHWNEHGHALAADLISRYLCARRSGSS